MEEYYLKKIMSAIIISVLIVLSFFLVRPILLAITVGVIFAFVFTPAYDWLLKRVKYKNLCAALICGGVILLIILPLWFLTPIILEQSFIVYQASQQMDFVTPLKSIFPSLFASEEFSAEIGSVIYSFVTRLTNSLVNSISNIILNFMDIFMQSLVVFFTFFFVLRDKEELLAYIRSLMPFSKEVEAKFFEYSKGITISVLYGQVIIGLLQGIVAGAGFFLFGVPNALLLTLLAAIAGIFPIIGTTIIWMPVVIYLFIAGNTFAAIGVGIFGLLSSALDNFIRPIIVAKRTTIHSSLILIAMVGGFFLFGVLGFILGPLILSYLLIVLEIYRNKKIPGVFVKAPAIKNK